MTHVIPLPEGVRQLVENQKHRAGANLGLLLDKYARTYLSGHGDGKFSENVQRPTVEEVARVASSAQALPAFDDLRARRRRMLAALAAATFRAATVGPLTLHLARASALENAGICLHPIYGFAYLPGTGLKGMAHAYACECWLPAQPDRAQAWQAICRVMGWAPAPWLHTLAKRLGVPAPEDSQAGSVVFHDAWPTSWPKLMVDIVNNHHPAYYQADDNSVPPPGDWENPVPVYFLAVPAGQTFEFAVSKRRGDASEDQLNLARQWLAGALCHLGAGAKTAAGYGAFKIAETQVQVPPLSPKARAVFETTLELVTPAFLAGASQQAEDCDLRPATLRGVLRWWWRTMHAGSVDAATLRRMEACIWGNTEQGAAVKIAVEPIEKFGPIASPGKLINLAKSQLHDDPEFLRRNGIVRPTHRTTLGLFYASYGTDDVKRAGERKVRAQRHCVGPGSRWRVNFIAQKARLAVQPSMRRDSITEVEIDAATLLKEAQAAFWLLATYGGIGSKSRKGFGSVCAPEIAAELNREAVVKQADQFRLLWKQLELPFTPGAAGSASFADANLVEQETHWTNSWFALDQIGAIMQSFAQAPATTGHGKHCEQKAVLGLPRQIHGPRNQPLPHQDRQSWVPPRKLTGTIGDRLASPVHFHLAKTQQGTLLVRAAIFVPTGANAHNHAAALLAQYETHIGRELKRIVVATAKHGKFQLFPQFCPAAAAGPTLGSQTAPKSLPRTNDRVEAVLLPQKTKAGGWRARHLQSALEGHVHNSGAVPKDAMPGQRITLIVKSVNPREITFRYPVERDDQPGQS